MIANNYRRFKALNINYFTVIPLLLPSLPVSNSQREPNEENENNNQKEKELGTKDYID